MRSKIAKRILDNTPKETRHFVRKQADIVVRISELMKAKGYTQKQLAEEMGKKPSEINRMLSGEHNFTFKSLCHIEAVLGEAVFEVPKKKVFREAQGKKFEVSVHRSSVKVQDYKFKEWDKESLECDKESFTGEIAV
ncbi:MAG: helix-turn-helix transcriptional regulator [Cyclobacteriaceae bacterium]